jgi:hypothetical protein
MSVVHADSDKYDLATLDERSVRRFARGRIFITFEDPRQFILIDSEVLDYILQLKGVIAEIDSGNHKTFTVSPDYYNNNLQFTYSKADELIEIYEVNGGDFKIVVPFVDFRAAILQFYRQSLDELLLLYPAVSNSHFFCKLLSSSI